MAIREYEGINRLHGPLIVMDYVECFYDELVEIQYGRDILLGKVITSGIGSTVIQIFGNGTGLNVNKTLVRFTGSPIEMKVSPQILSRIFDGLGRPIDGLGSVISAQSRDINGYAINPYIREYPKNFIETGISVIDGMLTLIRGQKLPIFSGNGLNHNKLAVQIAKQAKIKTTEDFSIVFTAIGLKKDDADFIVKTLSQNNISKNMVIFLNLASDPVPERIATPRIALTVAEYLAFELNKHVLVILCDMTNYCEALREISNYRQEVPGRKGFPGYLYSDLASLYERAGMIKGKSGSVTQIPIISMPNDDITHPIPDLTGFITEGQIVFSRELHRKDIYPPINILPSLSRLMKDGIGKSFTREDHSDVSGQLFAAYSKVTEIRSLASIIGEEELSDSDKKYLVFGKDFEENFINQGFNEYRTFEHTIQLMWKMLSHLDISELTRIKPEYIKTYHPNNIQRTL
ncbi:MAG TPA: V-type ATP synthase subunit B [Petrotogaceae bacterium]|nr:V-type ATP synthase subunit B [Petrotogaceae bacterium]HQO13140.1 V-type ATP synthase subunit B [Petrotogaceae bacterium]HQP57412.1 V-type ATP synthase subunit B [Petrotogaceae bacterium]